MCDWDYIKRPWCKNCKILYLQMGCLYGKQREVLIFCSWHCIGQAIHDIVTSLWCDCIKLSQTDYGYVIRCPPKCTIDPKPPSSICVNLQNQFVPMWKKPFITSMPKNFDPSIFFAYNIQMLHSLVHWNVHLLIRKYENGTIQ